MMNEILLALIQSATEFLPVSSSGHLALLSNLISEPDLFFITSLHFASLLAVLIFARKEIKELLKFDEKSKQIWIWLIIATIPATIFGFIFKKIIVQTFSSYLFLGFAFIFTGIILFVTRFSREWGKPNSKKFFLVGLFQSVALFPGISRSGMTISSAMFMGINREKAAKFSFLLFIPLAIGAMILEFGEAYFSISLAVAFIITTITSLLFLNILTRIIIRNKFWLFSFYCFVIGIISLILHFI